MHEVVDEEAFQQYYYDFLMGGDDEDWYDENDE